MHLCVWHVMCTYSMAYRWILTRGTLSEVARFRWSTEVPLRRSALCVCPGGDPPGDTPPLRNKTLPRPCEPPRGTNPKVTAAKGQRGRSKGIWRQGIDSFVRNSYVSTLCPVVICPCLRTSDKVTLRLPDAWQHLASITFINIIYIIIISIWLLLYKYYCYYYCHIIIVYQYCLYYFSIIYIYI